MNSQVLTDSFARDGFILIERLLDQRQIEQAQRGVQWAMERPVEWYKWIRQRTYECFSEQPIFVELIEHPLVMDFARNWLGPDFHLIGAQCSRNTRDDHYAPGAMKLHQDTVFFPPPECRAEGVPKERYSFSAMWYVQDTPLEMGPTELVRGSHLSEKNYQNEQPDEPMLFRQAVPAGSLLIFSHYTWHRGALNNTDKPRDLITNAYGRPAISKLHHLAKPGKDGSKFYEPPHELLEIASPTLRQLLRESLSTVESA